MSIGPGSRVGGLLLGAGLLFASVAIADNPVRRPWGQPGSTMLPMPAEQRNKPQRYNPWSRLRRPGEGEDNAADAAPRFAERRRPAAPSRPTPLAPDYPGQPYPAYSPPYGGLLPLWLRWRTSPLR